MLAAAAGGLLLPVGCDWRWRASGDTSEWYPSVRLYRQAAYGAWPPTLARVAADLRRLAKFGA